MDTENTKQIKYHDQPESTLEKIYKEIKKLYEADNNLCDILTCSGRDLETKYTIEYLSVLEDIKELQASLRGMLDNFNSVINDIEYEVSRTDIMRMDTTVKLAGHLNKQENMPPEFNKVVDKMLDDEVADAECTCDGKVGNNDIYCPVHCQPCYNLDV